MYSENHVTLVGRLNDDPKSFGTKTSVVAFRIGVYRGKDKESGKGLYDNVNIKAFGELADKAMENLKKDSDVIVTGRISTGSYEKDGKKVYTTDIVAGNIGIAL
jgi:single-strand DNA-binding protein